MLNGNARNDRRVQLLDGDGDVQDLVGGDEAGHAMAHGCEGQDSGGGAVEAGRSHRESGSGQRRGGEGGRGGACGLRVVGVELLFELVAGARGDLVNTCEERERERETLAPLITLLHFLHLGKCATAPPGSRRRPLTLLTHTRANWRDYV